MSIDLNQLTIEQIEKINPIARIEHQGVQLFYHTPTRHTLWRVNSLHTKEPDTVEWIDSFNASDLLLDVGANVGMYTILAAATRGCRVVAFEPESQNYALLCKNIYFNELSDKVTAFCVALSDETGFDRLNLSYFMPGGSCHTFKEEVNFKLESFTPSFRQGCFATTLDALIADGVMEVPNHIKIDVDGIEHKVIEGMKQTLKHEAVRSVLIEINTHLEEHQALMAQMHEYGFQFDAEKTQRFLRKEGDFEGVGNHIFRREAA